MLHTQALNLDEHPGSPPSSCLNIRLRKIMTHEQQRCAQCRSHAVAHAITEIERRGMSAFAVAEPRLPRVVCHFGREVHRLYGERGNQLIDGIAVVAGLAATARCTSRTLARSAASLTGSTVRTDAAAAVLGARRTLSSSAIAWWLAAASWRSQRCKSSGKLRRRKLGILICLDAKVISTCDVSCIAARESYAQSLTPTLSLRERGQTAQTLCAMHDQRYGAKPFP